MKINKKEFVIGLGILIAYIALGMTFLSSESLVGRMLMGLAIGYTLARSIFGFAGSVNRAYGTGSTKLMRAMMIMFIITAIGISALTYADPTAYSLSIYPINIGLAIGATVFGIGMALAACCASGVLTDLVETPMRAVIILVFFCIGVMLGFPFQKGQSWVTDSIVGGQIYENGIYLPELFAFDGYNGHLGAIILTAVLAFIVICLSYAYESKRRKAGTYTGVPGEKLQDKTTIEAINDGDSNYKILSVKTFNRLFVNPWPLTAGAVAMAVICVYMMAKTGSGWGVTTSFGRSALGVLAAIGFSPEALSEFSMQSIESFTTPFFEVSGNVQNLSIVVGALVAVLMAGKFKGNIDAKVRIGLKETTVCIMAGLLMGFGTRLANGCNAGGLFTPISQFSLSGWIFLIFMVLGGVIGNMIKKKIYSK